MRLGLLFAVVAMMVCITGTTTEALDLNNEAREKLQSGEPVTAFVPDKTETAAGVLEAVIDIPAKASTVWTILTDCGLNLKVFNGLKSCRVISQEADGRADVREHLISWSRLLPTVKSVFKSVYEPQTTIRFEKTEGDLKRLLGEWRLEVLDGGAATRLHYKADLAVGLPVPSALVKSALEGDMPKTMKAIRKAAIDGLGG